MVWFGIFIIVVFAVTINAFQPRTTNKKVVGVMKHVKTHMVYEVLNEITPTFAAQLTFCGSVIGSGVTLMNKPHKSSHLPEEKLKEYDIYRDSPLRYAGYLNEMGEAFRPLVPVAVVIFSYILTFSYVFADAVSKGWKYADLNKEKFSDRSNPAGPLALFDTLGFQTIASVFFPGFIINRWVTLCAYLDFHQLDLPAYMHSIGVDSIELAGISMTSSDIAGAVPTALGLSLIPFIVKPLDELTEFILDHTIRLYIAKHFPTCELPFDMKQLENL